jgi:hypothetical protein
LTTTNFSDPPFVQYLVKQNFAPGFEPERRYLDKINKTLTGCMLQNDPLEDYWDKVILIPLETYIIFDDDWMQFLERKSIEFRDKLLPNLANLLTENMKMLGNGPKEAAFHLIRAELILQSFNSIDMQYSQINIFTKVDNIFQSFWNPIFEKMKSESDKNQSDFLDALNKKTRFWEYHNLLLKFALKEQSKLKMRGELDHHYSPILDLKAKNWFNSVTEKQKNALDYHYKTAQNSNERNFAAIKFFSTLTPNQFAQFEREIYLRKFIEKERVIGSDRFLKFNNLAEWLKQNKQLADSSYLKQIREEEVKAAQTQAMGALFLGMASALNAYNSWNQTYYRPYIVDSSNQTIQLYDQFGNFYHGYIK